jgi:DNA-binding transcriptional ArsR family regulator
VQAPLFNPMVKYQTHILNHMVEQQPLDRVFAALADPTRRHIVEMLAHGESTLGKLAEPFEMSLPAVQKHLRALEDAGLVSTEKRGRSRHARLRAAPMKQAVNWMQQYEAFWNERLDALGKLLEQE